MFGEVLGEDELLAELEGLTGEADNMAIPDAPTGKIDVIPDAPTNLIG